MIAPDLDARGFDKIRILCRCQCGQEYIMILGRLHQCYDCNMKSLYPPDGDPSRFARREFKAFLTVVAIMLFFFVLFWFVNFHPRKAHAMEFQEVKPYVFAELPHGRVYKTVHEGCELYIVETDIPGGASTFDEHPYSITAGRGCK